MCFIDESGFNLSLVRTEAWSKKGTPAKVTVPTQRGINLSILGCISSAGIVLLAKRDPIPSKKRKAVGKQPVKSGKGTTADDFVTFVGRVMDILDNHNMKGMHLVMDNASIHHGERVIQAAAQRGYKPLFLPPYSPFLNPIEECWAKLKANVRRNPLSSQDKLSPRVLEAAHTITAQDCQGWIRHSESFWQRCLDKEVGL